MKVMQIQDEWGPDNIKLSERPDPKPAGGEIVIEIKATAINPRDLILSQRGYGHHSGNLPIIPLADGAGFVCDVGEGSVKFKIGDLVCPIYNRYWHTGTSDISHYGGSHGGPLDGTQCERMLIPESAVVRAPFHMTPAEAATLPVAALTSWNAIVEQGKAKAGDVILLQGTGGVSIFALQIAKMIGAETILISSSDDKLARAKALGADHIINYYDNPDWHRTAREITNGKGVDQIIEIGGTGTLNQSIKAVRPSGTLSLIGVLTGVSGEINLGRVVTQNICLQGITVGSRKMFENMVRAFEKNQIKPVIDNEATFAFDDLGKALAALPLGKHFGKVICEF